MLLFLVGKQEPDWDQSPAPVSGQCKMLLRRKGCSWQLQTGLSPELHPFAARGHTKALVWVFHICFSSPSSRSHYLWDPILPH